MKTAIERSPLKVGPERIDQAVYAKAPFTGWRVFVFLLAVLLLCYASVLVIPYAFLDDYPFLAEALRGETRERASHLAGGRPMYAFLKELFFSYMGEEIKQRPLYIVADTVGFSVELKEDQVGSDGQRQPGAEAQY